MTCLRRDYQDCHVNTPCGQDELRCKTALAIYSLCLPHHDVRSGKGGTSYHHAYTMLEMHIATQLLLLGKFWEQ